MICIDCDTEMTGKPVCLATRSAVRCRVPVSSDGIVWSGIRCTAARMIRVMSRSMMIAPSILASSRRPVAVNGTSSSKPPVEIAVDGLVVAEHDQRAGARAQDPVETVAQAGAGRDRGQRLAEPRITPLHHDDLPSLGRVDTRSIATLGLSVRQAAGYPPSTTRSARSRCEQPQRGAHVGRPRRPASRRPRGSRARRARLGRHDRQLEAEPGRLGEPLRHVADPAQLAGQADLAHRDHAGRRRAEEVGRGQRRSRARGRPRAR